MSAYPCPGAVEETSAQGPRCSACHHDAAHHQSIPPHHERCYGMREGIMRCVLKRGHEGAHDFQVKVQRLENRIAVLYLTARSLHAVHHLATKKKRELQKDHAKSVARGWQPAPGKRDVNLLRIATLEDILEQLQPQLAAIREGEECTSSP